MFVLSHFSLHACFIFCACSFHAFYYACSLHIFLSMPVLFSVLVPSMHFTDCFVNSFPFSLVSTMFVTSIHAPFIQSCTCLFSNTHSPLKFTHFIFNECPIYTHDGESAKFSTNSYEPDYSVLASLLSISCELVLNLALALS
jgi:hypothetical protein